MREIILDGEVSLPVDHPTLESNLAPCSTATRSWVPPRSTPTKNGVSSKLAIVSSCIIAYLLISLFLQPLKPGKILPDNTASYLTSQVWQINSFSSYPFTPTVIYEHYLPYLTFKCAEVLIRKPVNVSYTEKKSKRIDDRNTTR